MIGRPALTRAAVTALLVAGCGSATAVSGTSVSAASRSAASSSPSVAAAPTEIGRVIEQGVQVDLRWDAGDGSRPALAATFTPLRAGFHLYSVDLPADGVDGVGRPTTLEVSGGLVANGRPVANRRPLPLPVAGLDTSVSVYPEGPVTLRLPVRLTPGQPARAWVGYAACDGSSCLPPVTHRLVMLTLPGIS
jgi:hypothetical protein